MDRLPLIVSASAATRLAAARRFLEDRPAGSEALVVAATREAADDLVRDLACRNGASFGVHRFGMMQLAWRVALVTLAKLGLSPLTRLGSEALASRATFEALGDGELEYLEPVAATRGFAATLAATLADLRLARVPAGRLPGGTAAGRDLRRLALRYERLLEESRLADRARLLELATQAVVAAEAPFPGSRPVLLLDVPVASMAERDFVGALGKAAPALLATVPWGDERTLMLLGGSGRDARPDDETAAGVDEDLARLRTYLFSGESPPQTARGDRVIFFSTPGEGRECVEVARHLLDEARRGVPFDRMAVALRAPHLYTGLLETALRRAGVPAWFSRGTSVPDPAGRAFLALLACAAEKLSARRFAEYLSLGQVPEPTAAGAPPAPDRPWVVPEDEDGILAPPLLAADARPAADPTPQVEPVDADDRPVLAGTLRAPWNWDRLLVEAAVIGGDPARWVRRLDGLARELELKRAEAGEEESDSPRVRAIARDLRDLDHLRRFALPVIQRLAAFPAGASWGEWLDLFATLAPAVLRRPERVLGVLAELQPMAAIGPVSLEEVRDVLADRLLLLREKPPLRRYGRVFVGTLDELRGRCFTTVFVPALAERIFPQRVREDPLLLDHQREAINEALGDGAALLRLGDRVQQERTLLQLAAGAAGDRLYLSYPRMELSESRPRVPSFYALDVQRAVTGVVPDLERLQGDAYAAAASRLAWPAPLDARRAIDDAEHDLAVLGPLLHDPDGRRVDGRARYLLELNQTLGRSLRTRWARWHPKWSGADGLFGPGAGAREALGRHRLRERPYSVSALQKFAACPYQFLLAAVHRLQPREEAVRIERLDPLTRGHLFHRAQAEVVRRLQTDGLLPLDLSTLERANPLLDAIVGAVAAEYHDELAPAIERVWEDEISSVRADLRGWLRHAAEEGRGWVPVHAELGFGFPPGDGRDPASRPEPVTLAGGWRLHGVVDLVERKGTAPGLRVTDHKTGANRTNEGMVVDGGAVLQPVLYGLAVEAALGEPVVQARLFFCTARGGYTERAVALTERERRSGLEVLEIIDRAVEIGMLSPAPREGACMYCDFREVCGPNEEMRVARKDARPLADLEALRVLS